MMKDSNQASRRERRLQHRQQEARLVRAEQMSLYRSIKILLRPAFAFLFRPLIEGRENLPTGAFLLAANHRSFFDSVFQGLVLDQPIHWMAKSELFKYPLLDRLLVRLGAFPVRRGQGDQEALETARQLLAAGEIVAIFPEGTRVRQGLGEPKKGAARLAVEADVAMVPMAIVGTEKGALRRALWHQGERVRMEIAPPVKTGDSPTTPEAATELTEELWPHVEERVGLLEGRRRQAVALGASAVVASALAFVLKKRR